MHSYLVDGLRGGYLTPESHFTGNPLSNIQEWGLGEENLLPLLSYNKAWPSAFSYHDTIFSLSYLEHLINFNVLMKSREPTVLTMSNLNQQWNHRLKKKKLLQSEPLQTVLY